MVGQFHDFEVVGTSLTGLSQWQIRDAAGALMLRNGHIVSSPDDSAAVPIDRGDPLNPYSTTLMVGDWSATSPFVGSERELPCL